MAYSLRWNKYNVDLVLDKDAFVHSGKTPRSPPSNAVPPSAPVGRLSPVLEISVASDISKPTCKPPSPPHSAPPLSLTSTPFTLGAIPKTILKKKMSITTTSSITSTTTYTTSTITNPIPSPMVTFTSNAILPSEIPFDKDDASRVFELSAAVDDNNPFCYPLESAKKSLPQRRNTNLNTNSHYSRNTQQQTFDIQSIQNCTISTMSTLRNPILPKFIGPPKFDPSQHDAVNFLKAYTSAAEYNAWDDNLKLCYFPNFMTGSAEDWFRSFAKRNPNAGWLDTLHEFKVKFIGPRYADELEIRLVTKKQRPDESIRNYFYNTLSLCDEVDTNMDEGIIMRRVTNGLLPYYRHMVNISQPRTLKQLERLIDSISETEQDTHSQNLGGTIKNPKAVEESLEKTLTDMVNNGSANTLLSPFMEIDIQQFATSVMQHFGEEIAATEMALIAFQNDLTLKSLVSSTKCIWPIVSKEKYSVLCRVALKVKALFSSTYLCESAFSNMKLIKNKYRNPLTDEHLDNCVRMAVSNYTAEIKRLIDESECQPSH
ncbi:Retrotransposon gag protein [Popillia japonica]|uniref:Retrotransposon gag protein n=1 Tax=Popillia japonica TaxID=7064 RepID=A0AAW1JEF5_POPJA